MPQRAQVGTYRLDGLLQGPLGPDPDAKARLADWVRLAQKAGYTFALEFDGDQFSLLGDNEPKHAPSVDADMAEPLRDLIEQLVQAWPAELRGGVFSTVRSLQYGEGSETQTLYAIAPDGNVEAQQRTVDAATVSPPKPLTGKEKGKLILTGVVVLLAIFGLSSIFIDWGDQAGKVWRKVAPVASDEIKFETGPFAPYLTVDKVEAKQNVLHITLKQSESGFPSEEQIQATLHPEANTFIPYKRKLTMEALAKGWIKVEAFGKEDKFQRAVAVRIAELRSKDSIVIKVPIVRETPPTRLTFTW